MASSSETSEPISEEEFNPAEAMLFFLVALLIGCLSLSVISRYVPSLPYTVMVFMLGILQGMAVTSNWIQGSLSVSTRMWLDMDPKLFLVIFLPVLLFGDCIQLNATLVKRVIGQALTLAIPGVLLCAFATGTFMYYVLVPLSGAFDDVHWDFHTSMCLGSIISATDPVAVVALLGSLGCSPVLTIQISGESILNDGTAMILYTLFYNLKDHVHYSPSGLFGFMVQMLVVGPLTGFALGLGTLIWIAVCSRRIEHSDHMIQLTLTFFCAYASYYVADEQLGSSGVLATAVAGYTLASTMWPLACSSEAMRKVWHAFEYIANTLVFFIAGALLGDTLIKSQEKQTAHYGSLAVLYLFMLTSRACMLLLLYPALKALGPIDRKGLVVMVWGGLRGAVALALAVMLKNSDNVFPHGETRSELLFLVSGIVCLTLLLQATTCQYLVRWLGLAKTPEAKRVLMKNVEASLVQAAREIYDELMLEDDVRDTCSPQLVLDYVTLMNPGGMHSPGLAPPAHLRSRPSSPSRGPTSPFNMFRAASGLLLATEDPAQALTWCDHMWSLSFGALLWLFGRHSQTYLKFVIVSNDEGVKASYWELLQLGLIPKRSTAAQYLLYSVDVSMVGTATQHPLSDWEALERALGSKTSAVSWKIQEESCGNSSVQQPAASATLITSRSVRASDQSFIRRDFASSWEELTVYVCNAFIEAHSRGQEHVFKYLGAQAEHSSSTVAEVISESQQQVIQAHSFMRNTVPREVRRRAHSRQLAAMILVHQANLVEDFVAKGVLDEASAHHYTHVLQMDLIKLFKDKGEAASSSGAATPDDEENEQQKFGVQRRGTLALHPENMVRSMVKVAKLKQLGHGDDLAEELDFLREKMLFLEESPDSRPNLFQSLPSFAAFSPDTFPRILHARSKSGENLGSIPELEASSVPPRGGKAVTQPQLPHVPSRRNPPQVGQTQAGPMAVSFADNDTLETRHGGLPFVIRRLSSMALERRESADLVGHHQTQYLAPDPPGVSNRRLSAQSSGGARRVQGQGAKSAAAGVQ